VQRKQKEEVVATLHEKFREVKAAILTDFTGLNVEQITQLRRRLRKSAVEYRVVKNTLLQRASQNTDIGLLAEQFVGPIAIAFSYEDQVALAKILTAFSQEQPALEIKAGVIEGKVLTPADIKALASLPSREVLIANFLSLLKAVPTRLVCVLNNPMHRLVWILAGIKAGKENG
jgi:large subunit ribosomal protein L10